MVYPVWREPRSESSHSAGEACLRGNCLLGSHSHMTLWLAGPNLRLVEALHKVMFNQQTIGSVAMTHRSPIQVHQKACTVIPPGLQRPKYWKGGLLKIRVMSCYWFKIQQLRNGNTDKLIYKDFTWVFLFKSELILWNTDTSGAMSSKVASFWQRGSFFFFCPSRDTKNQIQ